MSNRKGRRLAMFGPPTGVGKVAEDGKGLLKVKDDKQKAKVQRLLGNYKPLGSAVIAKEEESETT